MLADVRKMVQDAWEFFAPPLVYASIAALFFWYLCGSAPLVRLTTQTINSSKILFSPNTTALLEKYSLTALVPVIALFLISIIAYSVNRVVFVVANLLPFDVTTSPGTVLASLVYTIPNWRKHLARHPDSSADELIDFMISKARFEKQDEILSIVDFWEKSRGYAGQLFQFSQFLLVWTIGCAALSLVLPDATPFTYRRIALMLILVISFGFVSASRLAFAERQLAFAKLHAAKVLLDSEDLQDHEHSNAPTNSADSEKEEDFKVWEQLRDTPWWRIGLSVMESSRMLEYYQYVSAEPPRPDSNPWLQAVLKNNLNIVWFIFGAVLIWLLSGLSWWLGLLLFTGYVSVTIIDCLIVCLMLAGTFGRTFMVTIQHSLPKDLLAQVPDSLLARVQPLDNQQYWLTAAAMRALEVIVAIILSRMLASYFF